jgi:hypothetical protein
MDPAVLLQPVLGSSDAAGYGIFGVFVVAILVLLVLTIRWTFRRDRALRQGWRERQQQAGLTPYGIVPKGYQENPAPEDEPGPVAHT